MTTLHYPNTPITEAIIDLRVKPAEGVDRALLKQVGEGEEAEYPRQEEVVEAVGQMAVGPGGGSASVQQTPIGWKFISEDRKQIVQSRVNGFTFSRLAPYESWNPFRHEAKRLWEVYRRTLNPVSVVRVAVRYINRIDIPGDSVDLKDYFRTSPEIAADLPQQLDGYFMQLRLPYPDVSGHCVINQTIVPPARENVVSVVLDIDLFRTLDLPQHEEGIWSFFEKLHAAKNYIFETCITDSARRVFSSCQS
jgi:uncharacterized protein (TIGR04255 family)